MSNCLGYYSFIFCNSLCYRLLFYPLFFYRRRCSFASFNYIIRLLLYRYCYGFAVRYLIIVVSLITVCIRRRQCGSCRCCRCCFLRCFRFLYSFGYNYSFFSFDGFYLFASNFFRYNYLFFILCILLFKLSAICCFVVCDQLCFLLIRYYTVKCFALFSSCSNGMLFFG